MGSCAGRFVKGAEEIHVIRNTEDTPDVKTMCTTVPTTDGGMGQRGQRLSWQTRLTKICLVEFEDDENLKDLTQTYESLLGWEVNLRSDKNYHLHNLLHTVGFC